MVDAPGGQDEKVAFLKSDPDPFFVVFASKAAHVKVTGSVEDVPDLLVLVQVSTISFPSSPYALIGSLVEERLDLSLVRFAQARFCDCYSVALIRQLSADLCQCCVYD